MAKPTDEIIELASFTSAMVTKQADDFVEENISLADLFASDAHSGLGLIVYFYPKDNTPGCTVQAEDFTAMAEQFLAAGYRIVGVSRDSIDSHKSFITKKELGVSLISDSDEALCKHFDVIKEKNMYGKKTLGLVRSTFVFNKEGKLTHCQRNLRAKGYAERLLAVLTA